MCAGSTVEMVMSDQDPFFAITSCGECGQAEVTDCMSVSAVTCHVLHRSLRFCGLILYPKKVEFPSTSDVFYEFDCDNEQSAAYSLRMMQKAKQALAISDQVQVIIKRNIYSTIMI